MNPYNDDNEGLGLSLLLYVAALLGVLAVVVVPVYLANQSTVQKNPGILAAASFEPPRPHAFPLSHLKSPQIVDPAFVANLNAKLAKQQDHSPPAANPIAHPRIARAPDTVDAYDTYAASEGVAIGGPSSLQYSPVH